MLTADWVECRLVAVCETLRVFFNSPSICSVLRSMLSTMGPVMIVMT